MSDQSINNRVSEIRAPFTPEQVEALNRYQQGGWMHPFTCGRCRDRLGGGPYQRSLVATEAGWVCETCDYTQDWAHPFMVEGPPEWWLKLTTAVPGGH
jgi:hypothetical protein